MDVLVLIGAVFDHCGSLLKKIGRLLLICIISSLDRSSAGESGTLFKAACITIYPFLCFPDVLLPQMRGKLDLTNANPNIWTLLACTSQTH